MNRFDNYMDQSVHKHLEIEQGDTTITVSAFDVPVTGQIEIDFHRSDNKGNIKFNSYKMFLSKEQFKDFSHFFDEIRRQISITESHKIVEELRQQMIEDSEKQLEMFDSDNDHVDLYKPNLFRDIMDSQNIKNKMRSSKSYCKKFYAAMCNTDLYKVGSTGAYGYSWRSAGGLIADILGEGDYLNWYCSGNEGFVDDEIADDLNEIGWVSIPMEVDVDDSMQEKLL